MNLNSNSDYINKVQILEEKNLTTVPLTVLCLITCSSAFCISVQAIFSLPIFLSTVLFHMFFGRPVCGRL